MKLFTGLKQIREFERRQLPFLKSVVDFDIVIEIGYAEEQEQLLTLKQLFLLNLSSRTTVRRKLARLIDQGIVMRRKHANDHRASLLTISASTVKLLSKYCGTVTSISACHFKEAAESLSGGPGRQNLKKERAYRAGFMGSIGCAAFLNLTISATRP